MFQGAGFTNNNTGGVGMFANNTQGGGVFNNAGQPTGQPQGLFANQAGGGVAGGGSLFGNNAQQQQAGTVFGNNQGNQPAFGGNQNPGFVNTNPGFANTTSVGTVFGNNNNNNNNMIKPPTFGSNNTVFGNNTFGTNNMNQPGQSVFGGNNANTNTGGGVFGNNQNTAFKAGSVFGNNTGGNTGGNVFGNNTNNTGGVFPNNNNNAGGVFGNNTGNTNTVGGVFGNNNNNTGGGVFGNNQNNNAGTVFGNNTNNTGTNNAFSAFGNNQNQNKGGIFNATANTGTGLFNQGGMTQGQNTAFGSGIPSNFANNTNTGVFPNNTNPAFGNNNAAPAYGNNNTNAGMLGNNAANTTNNSFFGNKSQMLGNNSLNFGNNNANTPTNTGFNNNFNTNNTAQNNSFGNTSWGVPTTNLQNNNFMSGNTAQISTNKFSALKPKNNKIDGKHLVKCITLLDQNTGFCKNQLRIRYIMSGGNIQQQGGIGGFGQQTQGNNLQFSFAGQNNQQPQTGVVGGGMFGQNNANTGFGANTFGNNAIPLGGGTNTNTFNSFGSNLANNTAGGLLGNTQQNTGFNSPAVGTPNQGGLFGNKAAGGGGSLFGGTGITAGTTPSFGQNSFTGGTAIGGTPNNFNSGGLFGGAAANTGSMFGNTTPSTTGTGMFGNFGNNTGGIGATGGTGMFGNTGAGTGTGMFSNTPTTNTGGMFGASQPTNNSLFGGNPIQNQTGTGFGGTLFGQNNQQQPSTGLFGGSNTTPGFGGLSQQNPNSGMFGQKPNQSIPSALLDAVINLVYDKDFFEKFFKQKQKTPYDLLKNEASKKSNIFEQTQRNKLQQNQALTYVPRYNRYNSQLVNSMYNFNNSAYLYTDSTNREEQIHRKQALDLKLKFKNKNEVLDLNQIRSSATKQKKFNDDYQPLLPKNFSSKVAASNYQNHSTEPLFAKKQLHTSTLPRKNIKKIVAKQGQLPIIDKGYQIQPNIEQLQQKSPQELKRVPNVIIQNEYGKVIFKTSINLYKKRISECIKIQPNTIDIIDIQWDDLNCQLIFNNFGDYENLNENQKLKMEKRIQKWVSKNKMNYKSFNKQNGELHVEINSQI